MRSRRHQKPYFDGNSFLFNAPLNVGMASIMLKVDID